MTTPATDFPLLLEPEALEPLLQHPQLLIIDLCNTDGYRAGHIPGAIHIPPALTQAGQPPAPGALPGKERLEQLFGQIGLTPDHQVIIYDDEGGGWAGRFAWMLDSIGHSRYSVLNGGMIAWIGEGRPVSRDIPPLTPRQLTLTIDRRPTATLREVMASLDDPHTQIWDARSAQEYLGQKVFAAKGGHIPGAVNLEWTQAMNPANHFRMKDAESLRKTLATLGITPDKRIITHCQTHHRSGYTYLVAKVLGFPEVQAYAGSWAEWGNHPDTPVES